MPRQADRPELGGTRACRSSSCSRAQFLNRNPTLNPRRRPDIHIRATHLHASRRPNRGRGPSDRHPSRVHRDDQQFQGERV